MGGPRDVPSVGGDEEGLRGLGAEMLFDLPNDPEEWINVAGDPQSTPADSYECFVSLAGVTYTLPY